MSATVPQHVTEGDETFQTLKGQKLHIRTVGPGDSDALAAFVRQLSPRSRRLRFFTPLNHVDPAQLDRFTARDFEDRAAFVATRDDSPVIVAAGRYELSEPGRAEVAFAVADELRGEGIGTELLRHMAALAQDHGIREFTAFVLLENERMFDVFRHSGYPMSSECDGGVCEVKLGLCP